MTPRVKPPHTLVSVLHWLWYCRATALSALANLTLLLGKNTLPFPAFGNLNFVSPPHRRAYTSIPKSCPNIRFPHQQDFFPIRSVTKSSTARFSHENLVEKFKIFVQDFVPIRTALIVGNFLPPWWAEAVIIWRSAYRGKSIGCMALSPKHYRHTLVLPPPPKSLPPKNEKPPHAKKLMLYDITAQKVPPSVIPPTKVPPCLSGLKGWLWAS